MASRYDDRAFITNNLDIYKNIFKKRGVKQIVHYASPELSYPSSQDLSSLNIIDHIWRRGDHYYKLADFYYGDSTYWWVIAFFNKKPTEDLLAFGDIVMVPLPLENVLSIYDA
tara:strand:+ start:4330 stop:4668 length:339 start_codon:yes stop_codon:yes gene_type:complete